MKNEVVTLITTIKSRNERGYEVVDEIRSSELFAEIRSAGVIESYEAQRSGVNISFIFKVDMDSYKAAINDKQRPDAVEYEGVVYKIHDVRRKSSSYRDIEIVCLR